MGTTNGTITDVDGNFTIQVPVGAKLDVSYIGYKTQQIVVGVPNTYKVILKEDAEMLDEVVVTGYGMTQFYWGKREYVPPPYLISSLP